MLGGVDETIVASLMPSSNPRRSSKISSKISPAFDPFLQGLSSQEQKARREAVVIYRAPGETFQRRGLARGTGDRTQARREQVARQTQLQQDVEAQLSERYRSQSRGLVEGPPLAARSIGLGTLPMINVEVTPRSLDALAAEPEVVAVLPNQPIHLITPQAVDYRALIEQEAADGMTWGLKQLNLAEAWKITKGAGVTVAVLDSGVYGDHPVLGDRVKKFVVVDPLGRRIETQPSFDAGQHGTHVCGTVAGGKTEEGIAIGVAPEADLLVAGVLVGNATLATLIEGMAWAVENGADIINMSLGLQYYEPLLGQVFDLLISQYDVLPVVAIGNSNHGNTSSPGSSYNAFAVGALEKLTLDESEPGQEQASVTPKQEQEQAPAATDSPTDNLAVTFFSSGASLVFPGMEPNQLVNKPDIAAPGAQVYSCIPPEQRPNGTFAYTYMDGTSMACPHVAGVAALLMSANPDASATDVLKALKETAIHPRGESRPDNRWGYGMVQPVAALELITLA